MGLLDYFFGKKPEPQPSGGLLGVPAGNDRDAYNQYAEAEMMKGNKPLSFPEWMKARQAQKK